MVMTGGVDHLVVFSHGIWGTPDEVKRLLQGFHTAFNGRLRLVASPANKGKTFDGVAAGGRRLADLLREEVRPGGCLSLVSHSLGGIYARSALRLLEAEGWLESTGVRCVNFVTTATPHLGILEIEAFWRGGINTIGCMLGATIRDLALVGDALEELVDEVALRALRRFRRRAAYGNLEDDMWVRTCTALIVPAIDDMGELPEGQPTALAPPEMKPGGGGGGGHNEDSSGSESSAEEDEESGEEAQYLQSFPPQHRDRVGRLLRRLSELPWERYLVHFPSASSGDAHSKICNHALQDRRNSGVHVVSHICRSFLVDPEPGLKEEEDVQQDGEAAAETEPGADTTAHTSSM